MSPESLGDKLGGAVDRHAVEFAIEHVAVTAAQSGPWSDRATDARRALLLLIFPEQP